MNTELDFIDTILFQHSPIGITVTNSLTGAFYQINDSYCLLINRSRKEILKSSWMDFSHPADIAGDNFCINKLYQDTSNIEYREKRYIRPDGSIVWVGITLKKITESIGNENPKHLTMVQDLSSLVHLKKLVELKKTENEDAYEGIFNSMAALSEFRDDETGEHLLRTKMYVRLFLENKPYGHTIPKKGIRLISNSAMIHDIGKVGIPDSILLKPGPLTPEEFEIMKNHTSMGVQAIQQTSRKIGSSVIFMFAEEIAQFHHERWDGTGYPHRLKENEIPLPARLMALADVYDALMSVRPYKAAYTHDESVSIILSNAGTHFDPVLVSLFYELRHKFAHIASMNKKELENQLDSDENLCTI